MKQITEELLMAYADGELDAESAREVQAAIDADRALADRVHQHRDLRLRLQAAARPVLNEPVPQRLIRTAMEAPAAAPVIDLATRRPARSRPPADEAQQQRARGRSAWANWAAWGGMAASLLVGVLIGRVSVPGIADQGFASSKSGLVAHGAVADALSTRLAGTPAEDRGIALQISFVDSNGRYCRTFSTPELAGLACRDGDEWAIQSLLQTSGAAQTEMRQAGTALPTELLEMVDRRMRGAALDAAAEQAALRSGWRR